MEPVYEQSHSATCEFGLQLYAHGKLENPQNQPREFLLEPQQP